MTLTACAACGRVIFGHEVRSGAKLNVPIDGRFDIVCLSPEEVSSYLSLPPQYRDVVSVFCVSPKDLLSSSKTKYYHLIPDLVRDVDNGSNEQFSAVPRSTCNLCPQCASIISKQAPSIPTFSVAKGYDFGNWKKVPGLEELSLAEVAIISRVHTFLHILKVVVCSSKYYAPTY